MISPQLKLFRYSDNGESSLGIMFLHNKFQCYALEDEYREKKVRGETRIPAGIYEILLRNAGRLNQKYKSRFPGFHKGMLHLQNVPNFKYIYIHIGNQDDDTDGCITVQNNANNNQIKKGFNTDSKNAYILAYKKTIKILDKEKLYIDIKDERYFS